MKIDYAIVGSDLNPMYLDFWPVISKVWKEVFNITPVLGLICDEDSEIYEDEYGLIKKFKSVDGVSTALQSQIVRLYLPKLLNGNCLLSDIDMVPLSKPYFINDIEKFVGDKFYVLSADNPECLEDNQYPICYNLGNSDLYIDIFSLTTDWVEFVKDLNKMEAGWVTDQRFLYKKINEYPDREKIVLLNRGWTGGPAHNRIDRIRWNYDPNIVKSGHYIDSHLLRPYSHFKNHVDYLINLLY